MKHNNSKSTTPNVPWYKHIRYIPKFVTNPIPILGKYIENYGDTFFLTNPVGKKAIITANPKIAQHVLQKNHRNYRKSEIQTESLAYFIGRGLLTNEGESWLTQRRLIQPGFHMKTLAGLTDIMIREIDEFLDELEPMAKEEATIDIHQKMMELAFRVVSKSLFSTSISKEDMQALSEIITGVEKLIVRQIREPYLTWWFHLSGKVRKHKRLSDDSRGIVLGYIQQRRENKGEYSDLLDMLLKTRYEDTGQGMTDEQLIDEVLILFVAGHETTANALAWTWYLLCTHPGAFGQLRKEINQVLGDRRPAFNDLPQLEFTRQVLEESMRLYPPAWITDRIALEDDSIDGVDIPKGALVVPYIYGLHHSSALWPDVEEFRPERFTKENRKDIPPFAYMPFGGGPRLCIGNNFAIMEMQLIIAQMVQRFEMELVNEEEVEIFPLITLRPKNGIHVRLKRL